MVAGTFTESHNTVRESQRPFNSKWLPEPVACCKRHRTSAGTNYWVPKRAYLGHVLSLVNHIQASWAHDKHIIDRLKHINIWLTYYMTIQNGRFGRSRWGNESQLMVASSLVYQSGGRSRAGSTPAVHQWRVEAEFRSCEIVRGCSWH